MRLQSTLYYSINDQSNWSGPFSLVVMTPDFHPGDRGSRPALAGCFNLQVYISPPTTTLIALNTPVCPKYSNLESLNFGYLDCLMVIERQ